MKTTQRPRRVEGINDPDNAKKLDEFVDYLDAARMDPSSRVIGSLLLFHQSYTDWVVCGLLERAARSPALTREEKIIIAISRFAIPELVRTYLDPDPVLDQARVTDLFLGIANGILASPEDVLARMEADILGCVPNNNRAAVAGLLSIIDKHEIKHSWSDSTSTNGSATPESTRSTCPLGRGYDVLPDEYLEPEEFIDAVY